MGQILPAASDFLGSLDGQVGPAGELSIPVADEGLLRGDGAFEVARLYAGVPFALDEHLERLARTCAGIRLPYDAGALRAEIDALVAATGPRDALLRVVLTRGGRRILRVEAGHPDPVRRAALVTYAPGRLLDGLKTLSYGANMLAGRLARERGFDDALLHTPHGRILEGPTWAFVYVLDDALWTPPLSERILDSITRRVCVRVAGVRERTLTVDELLSGRVVAGASTSTSAELWPLEAVEDRALDPDHPLLARAVEQVHEHIAAAVARA